MTTIEDLLPGKMVLYAIKAPLPNGPGFMGSMAYVGEGEMTEYPGLALVSRSMTYMERVMKYLDIEGSCIEVIVTDAEKDKIMRRYVEKVNWNYTFYEHRPNFTLADLRHRDKRCPIVSEQAFGPGADQQDCYKMLPIHKTVIFNPDKYDTILAPPELCEGPIYLNFNPEEEWKGPID